MTFGYVTSSGVIDKPDQVKEALLLFDRVVHSCLVNDVVPLLPDTGGLEAQRLRELKDAMIPAESVKSFMKPLNLVHFCFTDLDKGLLAPGDSVSSEGTEANPSEERMEVLMGLVVARSLPAVFLTSPDEGRLVKDIADSVRRSETVEKGGNFCTLRLPDLADYRWSEIMKLRKEAPVRRLRKALGTLFNDVRSGSGYSEKTADVEESLYDLRRFLRSSYKTTSRLLAAGFWADFQIGLAGKAQPETRLFADTLKRKRNQRQLFIVLGSVSG